MKIRLSQLRGLIHEAIIAETSISRAPDEPVIPQKLWTVMYKAKQLMKQFGFQDLNKFVKSNAKELLRITDGGDIEYLDSGAMGDAFLLANGHILKMQLESPEQPMPHSKWQKVLFSGRSQKGRRVGRYLPMVYDAGEMMGPGGNVVHWGIMEKFTPVKGLLSDAEVHELDSVIMKYFGLRYAESDLGVIAKFIYQDHRSPDRARILNTIGGKLGLDVSGVKLSPDVTASKWVLDLIKMMDELAFGGMHADFHSGNLGLRYAGEKPELVFFD